MGNRAPTDSELQRLFVRFDADGDGLVDKREFLEILRSLGDDPPKEVLSLDFAAIDVNGDGKVEFDEFRNWWLDYR